MEEKVSSTTSVKISLRDYETFSTSFSYSRDLKEGEKREDAAKDVIKFTESVVRGRIKVRRKNGKGIRNTTNTTQG